MARPVAAEPVRVLAAFTLKPALDAIAQEYRKGGGEVTLVYGPSPTLAQQIEKGAPADFFFSADALWMDELAQHKLLKPDTVSEPISNHLVLIARKNKVAGEPKVIGPGFPLGPLVGAGPLAMCDPESHPVGRYAKASLTAFGVWDGVKKKIASAENPLLAVKMVARGDVPLAIVFTSDALTDPGVAIVGTFPDDSHPPIRYPIAIVAKSTNPGATRFLDYVKSHAASEIFKGLGYTIPSSG
jgi:molybdate transport system substrate-binding protein